MDDDKREKLREYLRNNKPKSKINLGNNSNNKENSNKNLENDLNSDNLNLNNNSDLDNFQISNNKTNSNKRDYDKEPLFIKNHNPDVSSFRGFCFLVLVFISLFIVDIPTDRKIFNFFAVIILASRLATDPNKGKITEFKNDKIVCYKESFQKEIKISSKLKIKKTVQMFYGFYNDNLGNFKQNIPFFIVLFCFSLIFIQIFIENLYLFILIFIGIISLFFLPSILMHLKRDKDIPDLIFDNIVVDDGENKTSILVMSLDEYLAIRKYFLDIILIDLDKKLNLKSKP
ncbi:hypothetical protein [Campylobacter ureolyticus]|uniref:Membrane protein n=1 Tax=Campylobacter ureolyticus TaxID=827 RepID=A0AAE7JQ41_9BACT|nr:hypothetical protein [Campylobacter ureolyticus]MCR8685520.1 hypothetical protein [Campylobacter ureolyticus]QKF84628.1 putative membrane protein [Campylobacter ureolyticus]QQY35207.1 hypothetical protein I6I59_06715 [Campylobacter ureolyticus]SUX21886.1 Uncharacterised protein [Campylobacter ureolyticus]